MSLCNTAWPWFVIQVKPSAERTAANVLQHKGYECFLPLSRFRRRWSDRIKQFERPLFPGYLFCRFDPHNRLPILQSAGVKKALGMGKILTPVDEDEIAALQLVGEKDLPARPWPFLQLGQRVRIENGPLQGLSGIVVRIKSETKLVLSVTLLHRSVAVEVEGGWLEGLCSGDSVDLLTGSHQPIRVDQASLASDFQPEWNEPTATN